MKVLVTGGAGFIGSHLVDSLLKNGYKVVIFDNLATGEKENINKNAVFFEIDIRDVEEMKYILKQEAISTIFHLAALPRVGFSIAEPLKTAQVNIQGTLNVFKVAIDVGARRVIFSSSSSVYGDKGEVLLKESLSPEPISPYALQKFVGERFAVMFSRLYKISIISLRYFNVFGPRLDLSSDYGLVIGKFLQQKARGAPLTIYSDGEQTRSFCYIDDIVNATIEASNSKFLKGGEIINLGGKKFCSINHLASLIGGFTENLSPKIGDVRHSRADNTLAKTLLKWEPMTAFEVGIRKTMDWYSSKC